MRKALAYRLGLAAAAFALVTAIADEGLSRGGRAGGGGGGAGRAGGGAGGMRSSGGAGAYRGGGVRGAGPTSIRGAGGGAGGPGGAGRAGAGYSRPDGAGTRPGGRGGGIQAQGGDRYQGGNRIQGSGNRVNTGDVNFNRNTNINGDGWGGWDDHHYPVGAGLAVGTAAAMTAAAIGSTYYALPPSCPPVYAGGYTYYSCGGAYYEPRYEGTSVVYVTVPPPAGAPSN